jgi:glutathione S-transferase
LRGLRSRQPSVGQLLKRRNDGQRRIVDLPIVLGRFLCRAQFGKAHHECLPRPRLVTLATSLLLFACAAYVGRCRVKFAIKAPATSGHPQFEIAYRIQMNTLEKPVALPAGAVGVCVHLSSHSGRRCSVAVAGWQGLVRAGLRARSEDARRGFLLSMLAFGALGLGGAWGVLRGLIG